MKIVIINSKGHWMNGWMTFPSSLEVVINILKKSGYEVEAIEVQSLHELHEVLQKIDSNTLVWANAYWVNGENGEEHGLIEQIEKYNLNMVGSSLQTLIQLLEKDTCQQILAAANIPIPSHLIIHQKDAGMVGDRIINSHLSYPVVIKPTKEARSKGVTKVDTAQEAIATTLSLLGRFPHSNIIIEEFLPSEDITCAYLKMGEKIMLLPTYNVVKGMDCSKEVFSESHYDLPPSYEQQVLIHDNNVLEQLKTQLPAVADLLNIHSITRIDARLDKNGVLKVFDINGMPGLNFPISAMVKQCFIHFPGYEEDYLFECLINTILIENLRRYQMPIPESIQKHHLFNLNSETVIQLKSDVNLSVLVGV